jgi:hypothetical protein
VIDEKHVLAVVDLGSESSDASVSHPRESGAGVTEDGLPRTTEIGSGEARDVRAGTTRSWGTEIGGGARTGWDGGLVRKSRASLSLSEIGCAKTCWDHGIVRSDVSLSRTETGCGKGSGSGIACALGICAKRDGNGRLVRKSRASLCRSELGRAKWM